MLDDDLDALIERRRLRRRARAWRLVAVVAAIGALAAVIAPALTRDSGPYVARILIDTVIVEDAELEQTLLDLTADPEARALVVALSSPGGTIYGSERLMRLLEDAGAEMPVVAVMGSVATSGAYMASLAAERVWAGETTITGSVGVVFQVAEISELLDNVGITTESIRSGDLKAVPNPTEKLSDAGRASMQELTDESFDWFLNLVTARRTLSPETLDLVRQGGVFSGTRAVEMGLVDAIGGTEDARVWLAAEHGVSVDLPVFEAWPPPPEPDPLTWLLGDTVSAMLGKVQITEALTLDGLVSVWNPARH